ncbi:hypothetical protein LK12_06480 [Novosphingobium malaysiense]|uniref:L,D-TPase catalytic domain-containing protein n=1 Tax=Novosphingobium malaysiense TaxID=1348853 RepID=A0A0B1ZNK0_9SPHN|nr:hypothetical protein LK12_06480 [Novosphingobium malaysiense]
MSAESLKAQASAKGTRTFYENRGWKAAWSKNSADALKSALSRRAQNGLDHIRFLDATASDPAARDVALTNAALAYAEALANGATDPRELYDIYTIPVAKADILSGLQTALDKGQVEQWLASLPPQDSAYKALSDAYLKLHDAASGESWPSIPEGDLIHEGERDPRVPAIATALEKAGYLQPSMAQDSDSGSAGQVPQAGSASRNGDDNTLYTSRMKQAVEQMQEERGLAQDGVVGPETLAELNRGPQAREKALAVALERRRWLVRNPPPVRIDVNTAAAQLSYIRDGSVVDTRKVIVGRPDWETPQLSAPMFRLVANPTWTVPRSIEKEELSGLGPGALRRRNMVRRNGWIVQLPGPDNALGLVKFDLRDKYAIYLHDTGARSLFNRSLRQLSHGCVRVDNALDFASRIAGDQGITDKWQNARARGSETFVALPQNITVRLLYHPTFVDSAGNVVWKQDVYGWNRAIAKQLGFDSSGSHRSIDVPSLDDLGP